MRTRRVVRIGAVITGTALAAAGCLGQDGGGGGGGGGGSVEIVGAIKNPNAQGLQASVAALSEELGIDVTYTTLPDFDTVMYSRVQGNNAPDIAIFPQPGVLMDLSQDMVPLNDLIDVDAATSTMVPGLGEVAVGEDGNVYGLPISINVKSNVWYPVPEFEDAGYEIPRTHSELEALTEQIKADGTPPWCFAFEAQQATGWYVTDWIEEYVLRIGGPEVYDQWVKHEIPFNDPVVKQAAETFEELILAPGNAPLSRSGMIATRWEDGLAPLVADPPGCFMARQGNFVIGTWPPEVQAEPSAFVDAFLLPPVEGGFDGQPVLGGGDIAAAFTDSEEVAAVLEAMISPDFGEEWAQTEDNEFLSPHTEFASDQYLSETTADIAEAVSQADAFRFDGSDLMPGQVGAASFWTEMTSWVGGEVDLDTALANIEASWPQ